MFFEQVRRDVTKCETDCANILEPLQIVDGDLDSLNDWLDDAERLMDSHQQIEQDYERQLLSHEVSSVIGAC